MIKKVMLVCGVLGLLLYGQSQPEHEANRKSCPPLGPSGGLYCHDGELDIMTSVVPQLQAANRFSSMNAFSRGLLLDTQVAQPKCDERQRGALWLVRAGAGAPDALQVCMQGKEGSLAWVSIAGAGAPAR